MKDADGGFGVGIVLRTQVEYVVEHVAQIKVERDGLRVYCHPRSQLEPGWKFPAAEIGLVEAFALAGTTNELRIQCIQIGLRATSAQCSAAPSANEVFPCPGRAATIDKVDGWSPSSNSSRSW